ncbi:hypothetical protein [Hyphomonas sp.]|uniref:hypothetical protein n=1 Tax=Hyphomonas sp. TaxID=87 RepID=UPI00329966FD
MGIAVGVGLAALLLTALLCSHLGNVVKDREEEEEEVSGGFRTQGRLDCQTFLVKMLPLTAIKIFVTVWQIISQV